MNTFHPGVVYRSLREMEGLDWIESDWETKRTQGPPRRIYRLTVQGRTILKNWRHELHKTQHLIMQLLDRIGTQE